MLQESRICARVYDRLHQKLERGREKRKEEAERQSQYVLGLARLRGRNL